MTTAYFITFTTYGTWLHGDPRGSVDSTHNVVGSPPLAPSPVELAARTRAMSEASFWLDTRTRAIVAEAITSLAEHRRWKIEAMYVGTNHVHIVVLAPLHTPQTVASQCKAWSTRAMKAVDLLQGRTRVWTKMASTRYLNSDESRAAAVDYVERFQSGERRDFG